MILQQQTPTHEVVGISFAPLSADEMARLSVVEIDNHETNERAVKDRGGTLNDPATGCTSDPTSVCHTCGEKAAVCPGHFGHIQLAAPVFNPVYVTHMLKLLRCVCWECAKPRFECGPDVIHRLKAVRVLQNRTKLALQMCRSARTCPHCEAPLPRFSMKKRDGLRLSRLGSAGFVAPGDVLSLFLRVSQPHCEALGVVRPERMVLSALLVPPPCLRPQMEKDNGARAEEALTFKLGDIIKANAAVYREPSERNHSALQYYVAAFMESEAPCPKNVNVTMRRSTPGVLDRVSGKGGFVRGNIGGSRVDFSARSVAESDPNLAVNEVGVPQRILFTQFFTEVATPISIEWLQKMVDRGPDHPLGARHIHKFPTFFEVDLKNCPSESPFRRVQLGDRVERYYRPGDYVHVNRQPTLHKPSIQGQRVQAHGDSVFKVNTAVCTAYNLDFDGDEINLHFPQCHEAMAEVRDLLGTACQMVSTTNSRPIIMPIQDTVLGFHLLVGNPKIRDGPAASMMMTAGVDFAHTCELRFEIPGGSKQLPLELEPLCHSLKWEEGGVLALTLKDEQDVGTVRVAVLRAFPGAERVWRGADLLASLLPQGMTGRFGDLNVRQGPNGVRTIEGVADKGSLSGSGGLLHRIVSVQGPQRGMQFIWEVQRMAASYLTHHAFSIGPQSIDVPRSIQSDVDNIIAMAAADVDDLLSDCHAGRMPKLPGHGVAESFEALSVRILNNCINAVTTSAREKVPDDNALRTVVKAKSRASEVNLVQSCAALFQQNIKNGRAPLAWEGRAMTCFPRFSNDPRARGMISHSFSAGLTGPEFVMASMAGRVGLVDTAVNTGFTGYAQRRLTKGMENVSVRSDMTVRNEHGSVIMFNYGGNSFDPSSESRQPIWCANLPLEAAAKRTADPAAFEQAALSTPNQWSFPLALQSPSHEATELGAARAWLCNASSGVRPSEYFVSAVNIPWILESGTIPKGDSPFHVHAQRRAAFVLRCREFVPDLTTKDASLGGAGATTFELLILQNTLWPNVRGVCPDALWEAAWDAFKCALVTPGATVGLWSAFALGEPSTQLTLNTFHSSGLSTGQNYGISRFNEIINCNKTIGCPTTFVYLEPGANAADVSRKMTRVTLGDVAVSVSQCAGPPQQDHGWIDAWLIVHDGEGANHFPDVQSAEGLSHRLALRITFKASSLKDAFPQEGLAVISRIAPGMGVMTVDAHPDEPDTAVALVWLPQGADLDAALRAEQDLLRSPLAGITGIGSVLPQKMPRKGACPRSGATNEEEVVLVAEGTNILDVMALPGVDATRTFTNDIKTIAAVLGIEAARAAIEREVSEVLSQNNIFVNPKHVALVPAMICHSGSLVPLSRFGINRGANTTLLKASFEESSEMFSEAAFHGVENGLLGIADANFFGRRVPVGTGATEVDLDYELMEEWCENPAVDAILESILGTEGCPCDEADARMQAEPKFELASTTHTCIPDEVLQYLS